MPHGMIPRFIRGLATRTQHFSLHLSVGSLLSYAGSSYDLGFRTGSGLYIFFILANNLGVNVTSFTNVEFILDNVQVSSFTHNPTTSTDFDYNQTVYANNSMPYGEHTMTVAPVNDSVNSVLILFDYLIYTWVALSSPESSHSHQSPVSTDTSSISSPTSSGSATSSGPNVGAIVGGTIAGVSVLVLVTISVICYHRRKRRTAGRSPSPDMNVVEPFVSSPQTATTPSQTASSPMQSVPTGMTPTLVRKPTSCLSLYSHS